MEAILGEQASDQAQAPLDYFTLPINTIINISVTKAHYNQETKRLISKH